MKATIQTAMPSLLLALALGLSTGCGGEAEPTPAPTSAPTPTSTPSDRDGDGISEAAGDCDDRDTATFPGAAEYPDTRDNDCDGLIDEGTAFFDIDGDGYSPAEGDCDDTNPDIHPGAEDGLNGVDDNCDAQIDTDIQSDRTQEPAIYLDLTEAPHHWTRAQGERPLAALAEAKWIGDISGDGIEDVAISSIDTDLKGTVFIIHGPVDALPSEAHYDDLADWTIEGGVAENTNGVIIAGGGDIDGDGIDDLLVGDPLHRRVGLFYGGVDREGALSSDDADALFIPETGGFWTTGISLAILGDVDGDGDDEFALGQPTYRGGTGRALIFQGERYKGYVDVETAQTVIEGEAPPEALGARIFPAGDMNGDGFADFALLAPGSGQALDAISLEHGGIAVEGNIDALGTSYLSLVYGDAEFGAEKGQRLGDTRLDPNPQVSFFGMSADAGDFDGDGYSDLALGLPLVGGFYAHARILYGHPEVTPLQASIDDWEQTIVVGAVTDIAFGRSVALGDVDGDGVDDLAVASAFNVALTQDHPNQPFCIEPGELPVTLPGEDGCYTSDFDIRFNSGGVHLFHGGDRPGSLTLWESGQITLQSEEHFYVLVDIYPGNGPTVVLGDPASTGLYSNTGGAHFIRSLSMSALGGRLPGEGSRQDILIGTNLAGPAWVGLEGEALLENASLILETDALDFQVPE